MCVCIYIIHIYACIHIYTCIHIHVYVYIKCTYIKEDMYICGICVYLNEEIWGTKKLLTGLHSWVITQLWVVRDQHHMLLLQTFALAGNNFQPFPPCRPCLQAGCLWVSEGHERAVKPLSVWLGSLFLLLLNHDLSQTAAPIVLCLWLEIIDSWVLSLQ